MAETQTAQSELEIAETRLENAKNELSRLRESIDQTKSNIYNKEKEYQLVASDLEEASEYVASLKEKCTVLQETKKRSESRIVVAHGTPSEKEEIDALNAIIAEIETHKAEYQQALTREERAKRALAQVKKLQKEIATLNDELQQQKQLYENMQELYGDAQKRLGVYKAWQVRDTIECKEQAVKDCEQALARAKADLLSEQKGIGSKLSEWPDHARLLTYSHGKQPEPISPERELLLTWLSFVDLIREKMRKADTLIKVSEHQNMHIALLLQLTPQDFANFSHLDNWRVKVEYDRRGREIETYQNQRYDLILQALENYK